MRDGADGDVVQPLRVTQLDEISPVVSPPCKGKAGVDDVRIEESMSTSAVCFGSFELRALVARFDAEGRSTST